MKTNTQSVKTFAGLDSERSMQSTFSLPDAALMALEELSAQPLPEWASDPDIAKRTAELEKRGELMLYSNFGRFLPKGFSRLADLANEELEAAAEERGWAVNAEERLAAKVSVIQRAKELEQWKETQKKALRAKHHEACYRKVGTTPEGKAIHKRFYTTHDRQNTVKQLQADGSYKWDNATIYELPPLLTEEIQLGKRRVWLKSETKTGSFEPSRYLFTAPDGRKVDLGKTDGKWKPVKRNGPDAAMQSIAKRLGLSLRGGAASIIQEIVGRTDIVPSYCTFWFNEGWVTIISWQKDAKLTPATYVETIDGKLVRSKNAPEDAERLTVSKAEYLIISKPSIGEADEESNEVAGSLELDQELVQQGFERDRERYDVDADLFTDGLVLLERVAERMGRKVDFLCGDATWQRADFRDTVAEIGREVHSERRQLIKERAFHVSQRTAAYMAKDTELAKDITKSINKLSFRINTMQGEFRALVADMFAQLVSRTEKLEKRDFGFCRMSSARFVKETPAVIPGASSMPVNEVFSPAKKVTSVESIVPTVDPLALLQRGATRVCKTPAGTYSTRMAAKPSKGHTTAKNANPRLQAALMRIIYGQSPIAA